MNADSSVRRFKTAGGTSIAAVPKTYMEWTARGDAVGFVTIILARPSASSGNIGCGCEWKLSVSAAKDDSMDWTLVS